jgi:hypothetical protein
MPLPSRSQVSSLRCDGVLSHQHTGGKPAAACMGYRRTRVLQLTGTAGCPSMFTGALRECLGVLVSSKVRAAAAAAAAVLPAMDLLLLEAAHQLRLGNNGIWDAAGVQPGAAGCQTCTCTSFIHSHTFPVRTFVDQDPLVAPQHSLLLP